MNSNKKKFDEETKKGIKRLKRILNQIISVKVHGNSYTSYSINKGEKIVFV